MSIIERPTPSLFPISLAVVLVHALLFLCLFYLAEAPLAPKPKEKLLVRTIKLSPKPQNTVAQLPAKPQTKPLAALEPEAVSITEPEPAPLPEPEVIPETKPEPPKPAKPASPKPAPKPVTKPPPAPSKPAPKTPVKPVAKAPERAPATPAAKPAVKTPTVDPKLQAQHKRKQELLDKARSSLTQMGAVTSSKNTVSELKLPTAIGTLESDNLKQGDTLTAIERGYKEELVSRLKLFLKLPEMGIVKIKLTLTRVGKVSNVEILSSESALNRAHIEKKLPQLNFPSFGDNFLKEPFHTFQITLSND